MGFVEMGRRRRIQKPFHGFLGNFEKRRRWGIWGEDKVLAERRGGLIEN